ncbi:MAG: SOS response-associated peptidase [Phycisphaerales bacterium]
MCGRFVLATPAYEIAALFAAEMLIQNAPEPRYNIAPTQDVIVLRERKRDKQRVLQTMRWGLVPHWADDISIGSRMINARSETARSKRAFRDAFASRRCVIPADGFYEWKTINQRKQPYYINRADQKPMLFAGLWARWRPPGVADADADAVVETCTILTTAASAQVQELHDRMPVMLEQADAMIWMSQSQSASTETGNDGDDDDAGERDELAALLSRPVADGLLLMHPVSRMVNRVEVDLPACIEQIAPEEPEATLFGPE